MRPKIILDTFRYQCIVDKNAVKQCPQNDNTYSVNVSLKV